MARMRGAALLAFVLLSALGCSESSGKPGSSKTCTTNNSLHINKNFVKVAPYDLVKPISGIEMKRHHIIPKSLLISFFNKVVDEDCTHSGELKKISPVLKKLANYATDYRLKYPNILFHPDIVEQLKRENKITAEQANNVYRIAVEVADKVKAGTINSKSTPVKDSVDARGMSLLKILYVWNPFNILLGPGIRSDDPNDSFESNARTIIGDHDFNILKQLNDLMKQYTLHGGNLDAIVAELSNVVKERQINADHAYGYDASKWILENGKYRINTPQGTSGSKINKNGNRAKS